jgi:hypothetical protein
MGRKKKKKRRKASSGTRKSTKRYIHPRGPALQAKQEARVIGASDHMPQIIVPVLGMHRSGTSMLTRMLNNMGVELGEPLQPPSFDNPRGFWENRFFQAINMRLLESAGCNPDGFDTDRTLKKTCQDLKRTIPKSAVDAIVQYTKNAFQNTHWGWKDPRTVITWPFWERCLQQLGHDDLRPVVVVRHPDSCVQSLKKRGDVNVLTLPGGMALEEYIAGLWKTYYELLDSYLSPTALVLLQEDLLDIQSAVREMERCAEYLGVEKIGISPAVATIDVSLVSHRKEDLTKVNNHEVKKVHENFVLRARLQREAFDSQRRTKSTVPISDVYRMPGQFSIYVVSPSNYVHSHAFDEHALSLHYAFLDLGYQVPIVRYPWEISGAPIVLGANLLPHMTGINLSPDSILYNLEQILEGSPWLGAGYIDMLRRYQVWDYSRQNIDVLRELGIGNTRLCRIGYVPEMSYIRELPEDDQVIDVLFYGSLNSRRSSILDQLKKKGLKVGSFFGVYGMRRDRLVARAKIVINIHFYESKIMEIIRLSHLMANKKFIVSERGNDQIMERPFEEGMVFSDYDSLVETCLHYLEKPSERNRIAASGFEIFSANKQADFLRNALGLD